MAFKRKIYSRLLDWKNSCQGKKALLVEGARRIGKSTIVEKFAKNEYESYILIDFNDVSDRVLKNFDENLSDLDTFFMLLSAEYGVTLKRRKSVIIFDEIQRFTKARQSIKKLVKDGRYDFIETGSLISIKENVKDITIPSEERSIKMYPMDFEEFAWVLGEEKLMEYIRLCFEKRTPLEEGFHKKATLLFRQYMLVGGMPQSVAAFVENDRSFEMADAEKRDILAMYRNDIMKIGAQYKSKVLSIYDQIPAFLSQHEKRVRLSDVAAGSSIDQYSDTFFWLGDSMIANECFNCNDPSIALAMNENRSAVKCYMGDTGLLVSLAFDANVIADEMLYKQILNDKISLNEGMLYENIVAQMLACNGHKLFFYNRYNEEAHRNDIEVDFLLAKQGVSKYKLYPIEVKSTKRYTTKSLDAFMDAFGKFVDVAYIVHPKNLEKKGRVLCIPDYMAMCL